MSMVSSGFLLANVKSKPPASRNMPTAFRKCRCALRGVFTSYIPAVRVIQSLGDWTFRSLDVSFHGRFVPLSSTVVKNYIILYIN